MPLLSSRWEYQPGQRSIINFDYCSIDCDISWTVSLIGTRAIINLEELLIVVTSYVAPVLIISISCDHARLRWPNLSCKQVWQPHRFRVVAFPKFEKHSVYQGYPSQELELAWSRLLDGGGTCSFSSFPNLAIRVQRAVRWFLHSDKVAWDPLW